MQRVRKVWHTGPNGCLSSEANGCKLRVQRNTMSGVIRFLVLTDPHDAARQSRVLASGYERSAVAAMVAAEAAAEAVGRWHWRAPNAPTAGGRAGWSMFGLLRAPARMSRVA